MPIEDPFATEGALATEGIEDPFAIAETPAQVENPFNDPSMDEDPEGKQKAIDALVYSQEMGIGIDNAYEAHDVIKKGLSERGISFKDNPIYEAVKKEPGAVLAPPLDRSLFERIRDRFFGDDQFSPEKSANIMAISEVYGMSPEKVAEDYEFIVRDIGMKQTPTGKEIAVGAGESVLHLGTGFVGMMLGGVSSAGALMYGEPAKAPELFQHVAESFTYMPRSPTGLDISEGVTMPATMFSHFAPQVGDPLLKAGYPTLGATAHVAVESIPVVFMALGPGRSAMKQIRKSNLWREATIKERGVVVQSLEKTMERNPKLTEAELVKKSDRYFNEAMERRRAIKEAKAGEAVTAAEAKATGAPPSPMPNIKVPDTPISRAIARFEKAESVREAHGMPPVKSLAATRINLSKGLKRDTLLPYEEKVKFLDRIIRARNPENLSQINERIKDSLKIGSKRREVQELIRERKFERVDNLRKAMKLPSLKQMSLEQMDKYQKAIEPYYSEDVFLTQRQLETIDRTDISGVKTLREARDRLARDVGLPEFAKHEDGLADIKVKGEDYWLYDSRLAKQNPVYEVMVKDYAKAMLEADAQFYVFEEQSNALATRARKSRERTLTEKLIPTDDLIFEYLSNPNKKEIARKMTPEEMDFAFFLEDKFANALIELVEAEVLKTGLDNYVTNIRRDFFEALKQGNLRTAFKEILDQQKLDEQRFDVVNDRGEVLGLDKFFKFAIQRTGGMKPTKNVARAASVYFRTLEKKKALDSYMPKMVVYADAVSKVTKQADGLQIDQKLQTFIKEWINVKKGKPRKWAFQPGGKPDIILRELKAGLTALDLGFNITTQPAAMVGESVATYVAIGRESMTKGIKRTRTEQGKKIIAAHKNFVGKTFMDELADPAMSLGEKIETAMFALFKKSAVESNKISLLGSLTDSEFKTGKISTERLAEIKLNMGMMRALPGAESIHGSTVEAKMATQYKTWAVPILQTAAKELPKAAKSLAGKGRKLTPDEYNRIMRMIQITIIAGTVYWMTKEDADDTIEGKMAQKLKRESLTILGAVDPELWAKEPRVLTFLQQLSEAAVDIVKLEGYSETAAMEKRGKSKGLEKLKRTLTPRAIKQFETKEEKGLVR